MADTNESSLSLPSEVPMISALILTLDEEANIADCIESLPWRDDVWVLDSGSQDQTIEIARSLGAKIKIRPFKDYADQRNAGLELPTGRWIVMVDADERVTPELASEIEAAIERFRSTDVNMFCVRRKDMFMGRWLRRSSGYPTWFPRVFRRGSVRVSRVINETYETDGRIAHLERHLMHFPFNKGIDWWFERHNTYSSAEARLLVEAARGGARSTLRLDVFSADAAKRRAALKALAYRIPARPFLAFIYLYIVRGGFLDGEPGYRFATMRVAYEIMIDAKVAAIRMSMLTD